jgi:hypothetical protein
MDLSHSISIVISCPLFLAVTDRAAGAIDAVVALPFIGGTSGLRFCVLLHVLLQRLAIGTVAHSQATLPPLPANRSDNWRPIIFIRAPAACWLVAAADQADRCVFLRFSPAF